MDNIYTISFKPRWCVVVDLTGYMGCYDQDTQIVPFWTHDAAVKFIDNMVPSELQEYCSIESTWDEDGVLAYLNNVIEGGEDE